MADWMAKSRTEQIITGKIWVPLMELNAVLWGIPTEIIHDFKTVLAEAEKILQTAMSADRSPTITTECQRIFSDLVAKMRFIKDRYFKKPPLRDEDFTALLLDIPDTTRTPRGTPKAQKTAEIGRSGTAMLILKYKYAEGTETLADPHTDIACQVRYGVLPVVEENRRPLDLTKPPTEPEELPMVFSSSRRKDIIEFDPKDSGKTAYFCIRLENRRTDYGPWCPIFHAIVP